MVRLSFDLPAPISLRDTEKGGKILMATNIENATFETYSDM